MDSTSESAEVHGFPGNAIDVAAIERELARFWQRPAVRSLRESDMVPTRTSVLNLIVIASTHQSADRATQLIGELANSHPSRAIIFSVSNDREILAGDLDARVTTYCSTASTASGDRYAPCFEQILISISADALAYLPSVVSPLVVPDLPTFLWWPGQPPFTDRRFLPMAKLVDRLIVDSLEYTHCATNLVRQGQLCHRLGDECAMTDLNWARLVHWRKLTAQFFDVSETRWGIDHIRRLELVFGRTSGMAANPAQALLYAGWLSNRLGWHVVGARRENATDWSFSTRDPRDDEVIISIATRSVPRPFNGYLLGARLSADDGRRSERLEIGRIGADFATLKMAASGHDAPRIAHAVHAPPPPLHQLLAYELQRTHHDDMFEDALQEAARFAEYLRQRGRV